MASPQGKGTGGSTLQTQCESEADALFARLGVDDVRRVVAQTRADVAARSDALRAFVGEHHQDLVHVAEAVVAVADVAGSVLTALSSNDGDNDGDNNDKAHPETASSVSQLPGAQRDVCCAARLLRTVVCAPERVAALADRGEYLAAALAYHRACRAHDALAAAATTPGARAVRAAVPLAARQWAALAAVPPALCARSRAAVAEHAAAPAPLTPARAAAALGALLVLRQTPPETLVQEYLAHRTEAVLLPCSGKEDGDDAGAALGTVAERFVATLVLADALFCSHVARTGGAPALRPSLMERVVARVARAPALLPASARAFVAGLGAPFVAVPALQRLCAAWLADAQAQVRAAVRARLAHVASLAALRRAADAVTARLAAPVPASAPATAQQPTQQPSWDVVACALLRRGLDVWDALFAAPFQERAAALVAAHTRALTDLATTLVDTLAGGGGGGAAAADSDDGDEEEEEEEEEEVVPEQQEQWNAPGIPDLDAIARLKDTTTTATTTKTAAVTTFAETLDAALAAVCTDVAALVDSPRFGGVREAAAAGVAQTVEALAAALDAHVRDPACPRSGLLRCTHAARAALTALPALARLGTLCAPAPAAAAAPPPDVAPLARVYGAALAAWTQRTLACPLAAFRAALAAVPWAAPATALAVRRAFAPAPPDAPPGAPALPAFLTPCLAALLGDVAAAVARAHGDTLPRAGARCLARALSDGVLTAYDAVLAALAREGAVAPETAVQLWFDVYAVGELFSARTALVDPHDAAACALAAALDSAGVTGDSDAWPERVAHTLAAAQTLLDPVECGYFRPHMRACVARALQRSALLYALYSPALGAAATGSTSTSTSTTTTGEAGTALPCARVAARFALLPSTSSIPVAAAALTAPWSVPSTPLLPHSSSTDTAPAALPAAPAPTQRTQCDDTLLMAMGGFF